MRIGLAQLSFTAGDLAGNRDRIIAIYRDLVSDGAELVVFPELAIWGAPPLDLLLKPRFANAVEGVLLEVAAAAGPVALLVGALDRNPDPQGRPFYNAVALCQNGVVQGFARKMLMPLRDVFEQDRYFEAYDRATVFELNGRRVGVTVGEDLWGHGPGLRGSLPSADPIGELGHSGVDLLINVSAAPADVGARLQHEAAVKQAARRLRVPTVQVNAAGGPAAHLFEGRSWVTDAEGRSCETLPPRVEVTRIIDLNSLAPGSTESPPSSHAGVE